MRSLILEKKNSFKYMTDLEINKAPYTNWKKWKVNSVGICKTDIGLMNNPQKENIALGHEVVCSPVSSEDSKDLYSLNNEISCGECSYCKEELTSHCENMKELGVNEHGGYAEYMFAPESALYKSNFQNPAVGVFVEPLACAIHGLDRIEKMLALIEAKNIKKKVLILGGGISGRLLAYLMVNSKFKNDIELSVYDIQEDALNWTDELKIKKVLTLEDREFHLCIECSGNDTACEDSFKHIRKGGGVFIYGVPTPNINLPISSNEVFAKEITISSSMAGCNDDTFTRSIQTIMNDEKYFESMIGKRISLEELQNELMNEKPLPGTRTVVNVAK
jgi:threonine dehydrogenase-like Zn-dependent dehydrogenase